MRLNTVTLAAAKKYTDEKFLKCKTIDCTEGGAYRPILEEGGTYIFENVGTSKEETNITIDFTNVSSHILIKTDTTLINTVSIQLLGFDSLQGEVLSGDSLAAKQIWELISFNGLVTIVKWEV